MKNFLVLSSEIRSLLPSKRLIIISAIVGFLVGFLSSTIVMANELALAAEEIPTVEKFISDGSKYEMKDMGISLNPPQGWEVFPKTGNLTLIMQEKLPEDAPVDYEKPTFQRNITVAAIQNSSPIDERRAEDLTGELIKVFSKDTLVTNFQVTEHKFFNYRGKNDGLLLYSIMNLGEFPMTQMHVLISGEKQQFLLTYTDLTDRFSSQGTGGFETAWNSMTSIEVTGRPPLRYENLIRYGSVAGGLSFLFLVIGLLRRRSATKDYEKEAELMFNSGYEEDSGFHTGTGFLSSKEDEDDCESISGLWRLPDNKKDSATIQDDDDFIVSQY